MEVVIKKKERVIFLQKKWIFALGPLSYLYYRAHQNTYHPDLKKINLSLNSTYRNKPIKILHLSDLHMEKISITPERLYQELEGTEIDIIALTGDYLERKRNIPKFIKYIEYLHKFQPKYGIFAVFGNHDYLLRRDIGLFQKILEENRVTVLRNENRSIIVDGQIVNIIGIDDYKTRSDINKAYQGIKDGVNLVLTHDPNVVLKMQNYYFDYLLSGHFHGGQIYWPKPYHLVKMGKLARQKIVKGLHFHQQKPFYISEGLGQTALNIRLRSKPEITLHTLS